MRSILQTLLLSLAIAPIAVTAADPLPVPSFPLPVDETHSARTRWLAKPVLASRLLDDMEQTNAWSHRGPGAMTFTTARAHDGRQSIRLTSPTKTDKPNPVVGRPFGESVLRRNVAGEDWREFNRLSVWVYPDLPGFHQVSLLLKFINEGSEKASYTDGALNYVLVTNRQWNRVVWEIPHLTRDKVRGVEFIYRLQGNEPGATETVQYDLDQLELQKVDSDYPEGWAVAPGRIASSHTGYTLDGTKTAIASGLSAAEFQVIDADNRRVVRTLPVQTASTPLGRFQLLDFSDLAGAGRYVVRAGGIGAPPFLVADDVWRDTVVKTLNFFHCLRCGDALPGIHAVCHQDWRGVHGDEAKPINGGWHDAGDLSQGLVNTSEAVMSMLDLADRLQATDPMLAARLIDEARWGLDWMLKTRFRDGFRLTWATMDFWTDGQLGNSDDVLGDVRNSAHDNFVAAAAEAVAARVLGTIDAALSARSVAAAEEDWRFAVEKLASPGLEPAAAGLVASLELHKATRKQVYADKAFELASVVMNCQQREWPKWSKPLTGFFYTSPKKDRILHYNHRGHEQAPIYGLAELCRSFPEHVDWIRWYSAVVLHSEYLRAASRLNAPYQLLAASIYAIDESNDPFHRQQVEQGVQLSDRHYLRRFPVWFDFRGSHGTVLSQAKALSTAARLRGDVSLLELCRRQLEWVVGRNPFAQSTMYGEGRDYTPQYTPVCGDITGSLPVGIQTRGAADVPYWPAANCYNYAEVWVHPSSRWLWIQSDLQAPRPRTLTQPGFILSASQAIKPDGEVVLSVDVAGKGRHRVTVRGSNIRFAETSRDLLFNSLQQQTLTWNGRMVSGAEPVIIVIVPDNDLDQKVEVVSNLPQ